MDIAQAALELVPFEQRLRAGGTKQPVGRAQRLKRGEMMVTRDQLDQRSRYQLDARSISPTVRRINNRAAVKVRFCGPNGAVPESVKLLPSAKLSENEETL